jgi:putative inorganic carbon (hco3(-)) transporter
VIQNNAIKITLFYLCTIGFILLNIWFVVTRDSMAVNIMPFFLAVVLLAIFSFDKLIYLVVLLAPLSIELSRLMPGLPIDMFLPTEPILVGVLILFLLKVLHERNFDRDILLHPVSLVIYLNLFWIFITSITSSMPMVSIKFLLVRIWFLVAFYFLASKLFRNGKNMEKYVWLYLAGFVVVIFYAIYRHWGYGLLDKRAAHFVVTPFYNDHTSYGAAIAMYLPFAVMFALNKEYSQRTRVYAWIVLGILAVAFVLSYSRAAWLSVIVAIGAWIILMLKIRFRTIMAIVGAFLLIAFVFQHEIVTYLERNSDESSSNLTEHFSSMTNISTDASNLERLNRWNSALSMFQERPVFGYGPGTYMFQYAKYQLKKDRTIISTNAGDGGNAHSEYLGPLSESGVGGLLTFLLIILVVFYTGVNTWLRVEDKRLKGIVMAALLGLITYYIHGFLNNFLDTDKLSVPFWGFTAMIVVIDLHSRKALRQK